MGDTRPEWIDLIDPTEDELRKHLPATIHTTALEALLAPHVHDDGPRPRIESHDDHILGIFLLPVAVPAEDRVWIDYAGNATRASLAQRAIVEEELTA